MVSCIGVIYAVTIGVVYMAFTGTYTEVPVFDSIRGVLFWLLVPVLLKFFIQLVCAPLYSLKMRIKASSATPTPSVSVLVPAWNEEVGIVKTIQSVLKTGYSNLQLIVINDGSTDRTHEQVSEFFATFDFDLHPGFSFKYLKLLNGGKAKAMNRALEHVTGEIVVTIDSDSIMAPDTLDNLIKHFEDPDVGGVAGNVVIGNRRMLLELMQQLEYLFGFFFKRADALFNSVYIIGGAAAAYRRDVLDQVGGFDHSIITEDIEMSTRILCAGYKTRYAPDATVFTEGPSTLKGLCHQRVRWKYGRLLTFYKHRRLFFSLSKKHPVYLSFLLLPIAVYAEFLLLLEIPLFILFMLLTILTQDFLPVAIVAGGVSAIVSLQVLLDPQRRFHRNILLLAPVAWLLFYALDMIECQALVRSLKRVITGRSLQWQRWVRIGLLDDENTVKMATNSLGSVISTSGK